MRNGRRPAAVADLKGVILMEYCCICGKALPNRYAVAGRCRAPEGCQAPFCALCWRNGDERCPAHGGGRRETAPAPAATAEPVRMVEPEPSPEEAEAARKAAKPLTREKATRAMKWTVEAVAKLGRGAFALAGRLRKDKSPEAMIATLDASLEALEPRREKAAAELEALYNRIAAGKQALAGTPPARRRVVEAELGALLARYRGLERQFRILLDNERHVHSVRDRLEEMTLYGMATVDEALVDSVTDDIEEAAAVAEEREDAVRDLEKAGRRRDHEGDRDSLLEQLDDFAMPEGETAAPAASEDFAADDFDLPVPPEPAARETERRERGGEADGISQ
jgi:hypothetical protein